MRRATDAIHLGLMSAALAVLFVESAVFCRHWMRPQICSDEAHRIAFGFTT